jgi:membrane protease YdiL (CAAX protease family)
VLAGFTYLFEPYMPADFLTRAEQLSIPLVAKVLYGGITEEILIRWGLMSFIVWLIAKLAGRGTRIASPWMFVFAIIVTALLFGAGHLPLANALADTVTPAIKAYVFLANGFFGLIAGFLFWKKGLESAILSHMLAHIVWAAIG